MRRISHSLAGGQVNINFYEGPQDSGAFRRWLELSRPCLAVDTETTGLDIFSPGFSCRLVQFGDDLDSWVLPARYVEEVEFALESAKFIVMHNAPHDLLTLDQALGIDMETYYHKVVDTFIVSHILDPRSKEDDSTVIGHGLKDLATVYVDEDIADSQKELKEIFKANKWGLSDGWSLIPEDDETYVRYAGLDTIITARVAAKLIPKIKEFTTLFSFEHELMRLLLRMERKGIRMDVEYTQKLARDLESDVERCEAQIISMARELGFAKLTQPGVRQALDAVIWGLAGYWPKRRRMSTKGYVDMSANSNQTIVAGLQVMGETLTETTDSGALSVGKDVLNDLCDVNMSDERLELREPNPLAVLVKESKRAGKWKSSYLDSMLEIMDTERRVHPKIQGLKARTGRMAISRPPFQQLPSSNASIRNCLMADKGMVLISCDYDQVEMRLLAAMADEPMMKKAIAEGIDLHDMTATIIFGESFTKRERKLAKMAGFGKVYGGGAKTLAKQVGVTEDQARDVIRGYDEAFPGIRDYSKSLEAFAMKDPYRAIYTPLLGRRLPADEKRVYAVTNYMIQSTARDVFAMALIDLDKAGLGGNLLLPVHDEVIAQAPKEEAEEVAKEIGRIMSRDFMGVHLSAAGEVIGKKWGQAYE